MAVNNYLAIPEKILKTDILSTDSSFKLRDIVWYTGSDGVAVNLSSSDFGSSNVGYGVFEPRTSREEWFTWDTSTVANYATTGITILTRGLIRTSPYTTEATTRKFSHPSGSKVVLFTNAPAFYNNFTNKANDETITGKYTFPTGTNYPVVGGSYSAPTNDLHIATKKYVDGVALAGAPDATTTVKGVVELATGAELAAGTSTGGTGANLVAAGSSFKNSSAGAGDANKVPVLDGSGTLDQTFLAGNRTWSGVQSFTAANAQVTTDASSANDAVRYSKGQSMVSQNEGTGTSGEAFSVGQALYVKASDGRLYKAVGTADESTYSFIGIALDAAAGAAVAGIRYAKPGGIATGLSGLTAGSYYFITDTAGTIGTTPGTRFAKVGQALTTTTLRVCEPKFVRSGSQTASAVTTYVQTTGFYPAIITLMAFDTSNDAGGSISMESATLGLALASAGSYAFGSNAWECKISGGATHNAGTISARSQTGFTLNCTAATHPASVMWVAESL